MVASALSQAAVQRRFHRSLGALRVDGNGLLRAGSSTGLPAVVGLRARIVLPADFDVRYSADDRALILAHERIHRARRDVAGNDLMASLLGVSGFSPLQLLAAHRLRPHQETEAHAP